MCRGSGKRLSLTGWWTQTFGRPKLKIAHLADVTGIAGGSPLTQSFEPGMQAAIRKINEDGGVKVGGKSYRFELVSHDARSDPTVARRGAPRQANRGVWPFSPTTPLTCALR